MEYQQILELVKEVSKAGLTNFEYEEGDVRVAMSCPKKEETIIIPAKSAMSKVVESPDMVEMNAQTEQEISASSDTKEAKVEKAGNIVASPLVGTFYSAPNEGADPFVKIGDTVKKGDTLAIVEAMKLMNEIESEYDGVVTEILVKNEENVEYGQPLFRIE